MLGMGMPGMPLGYVLGYWPGGYCPGGYWPGGYCPGYCPPVGYCAEARTPHRRIAAAATTAGRKGRRIMGMPPGSILYVFCAGGTPTVQPRSASPLDVALRAIGRFGLEGGSAGVVAETAGGLGGLGSLVHAGLPVQRRLGILRPLRRMAGLAFVLLALGVRRVIVRDVAVLGGKHEFGRRLFILGHHGRQRDHGEKQKISQCISHDGHYK